MEAAAGVALWIAGVRAGFFGVAALDLALTVLWVVAVTNAVNLLDNMDGLASGVAAVSALGFFAIAAARGRLPGGVVRARAWPARAWGSCATTSRRRGSSWGTPGSLMLGFLLAASA